MADLNALILFARVVEANGFSEAARRLGVPVSTISRRIAELESSLGVRLLERSTRRLRLTDIGADILEHARRGAEIGEAVDGVVSNRSATVAGLLRLSAPPSISDTLLAPLLGAFQIAHPETRVEVLVTDRMVDHIGEGIDLTFRLGPQKNSALVAQKLLTYRHRLVTSPAYLSGRAPPARPADLLDHRLLSFAHWKPNNVWRFVNAGDGRMETVAVVPDLSMNDFAGLAAALVAGAGIGEMPPIVRPDLLRDGQLMEIMPDWRFRTLDLSMVHLGGRHQSPPVRAFKAFALRMAPTLFPVLPA